MKSTLAFAALALAGISAAQIPDTFNFFDAGGRWSGAGSAFNVTSADTFSMLNNPAGLGYISSKQYAMTFRSMPRSLTAMSGSVGSPTLSSTGVSGGRQLSHFGYALPLSGGGTLGIGYTAGGSISDFRSGTNLVSGAFSNVSYNEEFKASTDYITISKGSSSADGSRATGFGLVIASFNAADRQFAQIPGNPATTLIDSDESGTSNGVGLVYGQQLTPKNDPNASIGFSVRTPINLNGNAFAKSVLKTLPGVVSVGYATRKDGLQGGKNYLLYGAQVNHYFGGSGGTLLNREDTTTLGVGAEYNLVQESANIPFRIGYVSVPAGGAGFSNRNTFTYGIGYEAKGKPWAVHLNYGSPRPGGSDFALLISFKLEK